LTIIYNSPPFSYQNHSDLSLFERNNTSTIPLESDISKIAQLKIGSIDNLPKAEPLDFLMKCKDSLENFSVNNVSFTLKIIALNTNTWKKDQKTASLITKNLQELIEKINTNIDLFSAHELVNISQSLANLHIKNDNLLDSISRKIIDGINDLNYNEISNIAYAFAILRFKSIELFKTISIKAYEEIKIKNLRYISYKNLTNLAWSFAIMNTLSYSEEESSFKKLCQTNIDIFSGLFLLKARKDKQKDRIYSINIQQVYSSILSLDEDSKCYLYNLEEDHLALFRGHLFKKSLYKQPKSSFFHQEVNIYLKRIMKRDFFETEYFFQGYFLDTVIDKEKKIVLEINGPSHFLTNGDIKGPDLLRSFILEKNGWTIIDISYIEWISLKDEKEKELFLKNKLSEKNVVF